MTPRYLTDLTTRIRDSGLSNVTVVAGAPHDPRLPANSVDAAVHRAVGEWDHAVGRAASAKS